MRRWFILLGLILFHTVLQASTITAYLEVVLSKSGTLIDGPTDVTVSLHDPNNQVQWSETHKNVNFFKGVAAFEIGQLKEIKALWFYDKGVQLKLTIGTDTINLPMYSTPFSLFSHAADVVNAIQACVPLVRPAVSVAVPGYRTRPRCRLPLASTSRAALAGPAAGRLAHLRGPRP